MDASSLDLSQYSDASQNYSFNITVGKKSTVINFNGGSADSVRSQINSQLKDAYGSSNTSGQGLVYVNDSGKIISSDRQAMSLTGVANMYGNFTFDLNTSISAGTNKFNITVGDETVSVSFDSYTADYFNQTDSTTLGAQKREEFQGIYFDEQAEKLYNAAKADGSVDFDALKAQAYDKAKQADYDKKFESEKTKAMAEYDEELKTNYDNGIADGSIAEGTSFEDWKKRRLNLTRTLSRQRLTSSTQRTLTKPHSERSSTRIMTSFPHIRIRLMPMISSCPTRILPLMQTSTN